MNLQPGVAVTPTIRLVRRLGAGGMGSVWVADHLALRTQVVVKFMAPELVASGDAVERFSREAGAAAQVKSPHVVQMLDHGITPLGIPFIVMELLEGKDLAQHLAERGGRLTLVEISEIVAQVAKALVRAHERGIVHRDIKPENIFLCDVGGNELFVKLLDFGIAKAGGNGPLSGGTKTGATLGTPYYMSPEQMVGARTIDSRSDLWSLGVVVYQCVLGVRPFDAETFGALAVMIHTAPVPAPSATDPSVPASFDRWFAQACARDAAARFANARDLADSLSAVARAEPWAPTQVVLAPPFPQAHSGNTPSPLAGSAPGMPVGAPQSSTHGGLGMGSGAQTPPKGSGAMLAAIAVGILVVGLGLAGGGWMLSRGRLGSSAKAQATGGNGAVLVPTAAPAAPSVSSVELSPVTSAPSATPSAAASVAPAPPASSQATAASGALPAHGPAAPIPGVLKKTPVPTTAPTPATAPKKKDERDIF